jgi:tetratricopeptide (TPR) repeat protein
MIFRTCLAALLGLMLGAVALAQNSGSESMLDTLFRKLQEASDPVAVQNLEAAIWEMWTMPPDAGQRTLMVQGIAQMQAADLNGALATFNELVKTAPDLSEAWNKRATVQWLRGDFPASVKDICETLKREPRHFGALSGLGMIRAEMNEPARAVAAFELARKYNPHIVGIDAEIARLKEMGGEVSATDPLGCGPAGLAEHNDNDRRAG